MHADHSIVVIIAHAMIAFLFLYRGVTAIGQFGNHAARFKRLKIPFPEAVLGCGLATMLIGGTLVALDFHAWIGAIMLIVFTVVANFIYHDFWSMEDAGARRTHLHFFCNNVAVAGGLLMVVG